MKKRILSVLLVCVMLVTLVPTFVYAGYEDGAECANCGHYHWDDYMCKCGLCSIDCTNTDCWYETHCKECGECYMDVHTWCDECGWCENCMESTEKHCKDCGRCFVGEGTDELCDECHRCSDCVGAICDECSRCDECAEDEHCKGCSAHLYGDEACGYCDDCAKAAGLHCESCGDCFEDTAEHCPVHEDGSHCESCAGFICEACNRCEYEDDIDSCPDCGLCEECCAEKSREEGCSTGEVCIQSGDWDEHFCEECGSCFCEKEQCEICGLCKECCAGNAEAEGCDCGDVCVKSSGWAAHLENYHGEEGAPEDHTHKYKNEWSVSENSHWHECRFCDAKSDKEEHQLTAAGKCEKCGYDTTNPLFFVSQPGNLTRKVTDGNADDTDPTSVRLNRAVFSVMAVNLDGEALEFQWYEVATSKKSGEKSTPKALTDDTDGEPYFVRGANTNRLDVAVSTEGCLYEYEYYCVVTSKNAKGENISVESRHARLYTVHNYGELKPDPDSGHISVITYIDDEKTEHKNVRFTAAGSYHNYYCLGNNCEHTKLPEKTEHSYVYDRYLGYGHYSTASEGDPVKYFYISKCSECGYENLISCDEKPADLLYNITIIDTPGAYMMDVNDEEGITLAKAGDELWALAPYVNEKGNAFDHWEVVSGPEGFTNESVMNEYAVGSFRMPAGNIKLRGVYTTDKASVSGVEVEGVSHKIEDGYITVEVGETFTVKAIVSPENAKDKSVEWWVETSYTDPVITVNEEYRRQDSSINISRPVEGSITLTACRPGTVMLRVLSVESMNTSLNTIQNRVFVRVVPAGHTPEHVHSANTGKWLYDDGNHWNPCADDTCSEHLNETAHRFVWKIDKEATVAENGCKHEECTVCGAKRSENTVIHKLTGENEPKADTIVVAETGDRNRILLWTVVFLFSSVGVTGIFAFRRKKATHSKKSKIHSKKK